MIIIYGKRQYSKRRGRVAEFCPICRAVRSCNVTEICSVTHLYYLPLSRPKTEAYRVLCEQCKSLIADDVADYISLSKDKRLSLADLIERTNPAAEDTAIHQLTLEERAASGDLSVDERYDLLNKPFLLVAPQFELRKARIHVDRRSAAWLLMTFVAPWLLLIPAFTVQSPAAHRVLLYAGLMLAAFSLLMLIHSLATDPMRFLNRRYRRFIAESFAEIDPTHEELKMVLSALRSQGVALGRKLRPEWVLEAIRALREPAGHSANLHDEEDTLA